MLTARHRSPPFNPTVEAVRECASCIVAASPFCCSSPCLEAQNRFDVRERFTKAADQTDLRSEGGPPFNLVAATNILNNKGQSLPGTYQLEWKSKNQWRATIVLPGYERTQIGDDGKELPERSINYGLLQVWQLDRALEFPQRLRNSADKSSGKIKTEKAGQKHLERVRVRQDNVDVDFCFDAKNGALIREAVLNEEQVRERI